MSTAGACRRPPLRHRCSSATIAMNDEAAQQAASCVERVVAKRRCRSTRCSRPHPARVVARQYNAENKQRRRERCCIGPLKGLPRTHPRPYRTRENRGTVRQHEALLRRRANVSPAILAVLPRSAALKFIRHRVTPPPQAATALLKPPYHGITPPGVQPANAYAVRAPNAMFQAPAAPSAPPSTFCSPDHRRR